MQNALGKIPIFRDFRYVANQMSAPAFKILVELEDCRPLSERPVPSPLACLPEPHSSRSQLSIICSVFNGQGLAYLNDMLELKEVDQA